MFAGSGLGGSSLLSTTSSLTSTGSLLSSVNTKSNLKRKEKPDSKATPKSKKGKPESTGQLKTEVDSQTLMRSKIYQTQSSLLSSREEKPQHRASSLLSPRVEKSHLRASLLISPRDEKSHLGASLLRSSLLSSTTSRKKSDVDITNSLLLGSNVLSSVSGSSLLSSPSRFKSTLQSSSFLGTNLVKEKKAEKRKHEVDPVQRISYKHYEVSPPEYDMGQYVLSTDEGIVDIAAFIPPEKDISLSSIPRPLDDINGIKVFSTIFLIQE